MSCFGPKTQLIDSSLNMGLVECREVLFRHFDRRVAQQTTDRVDVNSLFDPVACKGGTYAMGG